MATYDSFVNNEHNPFVEQLRRDEGSNPVKGRESQPLIGAVEGGAGAKAALLVDDSENDEEAHSGFVIHVATEPGKGKAVLKFIVWGTISTGCGATTTTT